MFILHILWFFLGLLPWGLPLTIPINTTIPHNFTLNLIPMDEMGCWKPPLDAHDLYMAVQRLKKWGEKSKVGAGNYHGEAYGEAGAWVCNCKHFMMDHLPAAEIDEAYEMVNRSCRGWGGWVWSGSWQKAWNFGSNEKMHHTLPGSSKCPKGCLWAVV
ncbi:hypothetical protein F5B22DRAFT_31094 [Xylaria bambusicola]|uniref:uncharacterized protein n=1 Tax=Xylaria bambusicola TaxID=326684 RepID=UPI0020072920|nr:uncharacterized protein F5B22DRAFT_31094 [Xylaria bambusicola]KAI0528318.1 hypothetical protein F5B22DRAFT_31094 [Xylaria bambusicola]